jgi:hypothetical protein
MRAGLAVHLQLVEGSEGPDEGKSMDLVVAMWEVTRVILMGVGRG